MKKIFSRLSDSASLGIRAYSKEYLSSVRDVYPIIANPNLLRSHIKTEDFGGCESLLKFSLVFNDLSLLTINGTNEIVFNMMKPKWFEEHFGVKGASVEISADLLKELGGDPEKLSITPSFIFPLGESIDKMLNELSSFMERGRLLMQPARTLLYLENEKNDKGGQNWKALSVSQFSSLEKWEIIDEKSSRPIPISFDSNDHLDQQSMFEITIPYLEGVSFNDLEKILDDEGDLISGVRQSIKQAISECGNGVDPRLIAKDIIDPKVDALNRKFNSIINSHVFRIAGASVGTVVLAYTAVATSGISSSLATICGSTGFGLLGKEYSSYKEKVNALKYDPYYFLWRCKKVQKEI
ncbi:hypothetical protein ACJJI3_00200 [Microbulbifer sp. ZKSA004]|uniref:hypothetical protein n=1 Tax=Microbulbifer sp. ZKSA004 TaxID=3243389 RepID=UPI0040396136